MKKALKIYWPYLILAAFVVVAVIGWFVLPAEVAVRTTDTTLPKLIALLVPVALSAWGSSMTAVAKRRWAGVVVLVVAAVIDVMLFAWNL